MKHILLYFFICFSTCVVAQSFTQTFVQVDKYGISSYNSSNLNPSISIFPNPTTDFITISDKDGVVTTATIYNMLGKEIATFNINYSSTYDMMQHQKGIYLVQLKDEKGQIIQTVRVRKI